jgi:hypothetical protein
MIGFAWLLVVLQTIVLSVVFTRCTDIDQLMIFYRQLQRAPETSAHQQN